MKRTFFVVKDGVVLKTQTKRLDVDNLVLLLFGNMNLHTDPKSWDGQTPLSLTGDIGNNGSGFELEFANGQRFRLEVTEITPTKRGKGQGPRDTRTRTRGTLPHAGRTGVGSQP